MINLSRNKNICCGLKKVVAKSRARVYSEQQILALLLVFHQTHNLSRNKCARVLANQPAISTLHFFNPQQMFLLRVKLIMQGEKRETSTKTCNETMLRDKLRVFVSRLSFPFLSLVLHCASLLCTIFASLARPHEHVRVQNVRDFDQTKPDSEINAPFLSNAHGDPRFFSRYLLRTV